MAETHKQLSRKDWVPAEGAENSYSALQLGCLQRIADACELMAKNYNELIADRDFQKRYRLQAEALLRTERRRTAALRGQITRMKKSR